MYYLIQTEIEKLDALKHLNLKSNLISNLNQIKNLRCLKLVKYVNIYLKLLIKKIYYFYKKCFGLKLSVHQNPIHSNPLCGNIVNEILALTDNNNQLKRTKDFPAFQKVSNTNKSKKSQAIQINKLVYSSPKLNTGSLPLKQNETVRRKLKAHNVLIEPEMDGNQNEASDFIIINSFNPLSDSVDYKTNLINSSSVMIGKDYESNKLQIEIENLKRMRQDYGTDWLLSTPNLIIKSNPKENTSDIKEAQFTADSTNGSNKTEEENIQNKLEILHVIDSFVVYRTLCENSDSDMDSTDLVTKVCILSLNESFLIEKDETDTEFLSINAFADFTDINIIAGK